MIKLDIICKFPENLSAVTIQGKNPEIILAKFSNMVGIDLPEELVEDREFFEIIDFMDQYIKVLMIKNSEDNKILYDGFDYKEVV